MDASLSRNLYVIKQQITIFSPAHFDLYDPDTGERILECHDEEKGFWVTLMRHTKDRRKAAFDLHLRVPGQKYLLRIKRGYMMFVSHVQVLNEQDQLIGGFKQKVFSIGGAFDVVDARDQVICQVKGNWTGWDFQFLVDGQTIAKVTKKWEGIGKALFTSADNYVLEIDESVPSDHPLRQLILATVLCIDMAFKER